MNGILIYHWAKLWIQQSITQICLSYLILEALIQSQTKMQFSLVPTVSLTGVYFWICVFSILSRSVLLSWFWIRFFLYHYPHPVTKFFLEHVCPKILFNSVLPETLEILFLLSGKSWCNCRHAIEISHMILRGFFTQGWTSFPGCIIWCLQSSWSCLSSSTVCSWPLQPWYNRFTFLHQAKQVHLCHRYQ